MGLLKYESVDHVFDFDRMIDRKNTYCTQWDYVKDRFGKEDLLPFTISDTDFPVPNSVLNALVTRVNHPIFGYTRWNHDELKLAIKGWLLQRFKITIDKDWVLYSPSVIYSVSQLIDINSDSGDGVIIQTPAYDAFFKVILGNNRRIVENQLVFRNDKYEIDFEDLEKKLANPQNKILLFCSPHNPTGRVWTENELQKVVRLCEKYNVFIISDEIHMDIVRPQYSHKNLVKYTTDRIAIVTSGTKTFNFPGLVFSYLIIPDSSMREKFSTHLKNKDGLSSCSILGMYATMEAYNSENEWVNELNLYIDHNIEIVRDFLKKNIPEISLVEPEATYLLWLNFSKLNVTNVELQKYLINFGKVAIMDGEIYGADGNKFLRLNVGCSKYKLIDGLNRLKHSVDILKQMK